MAAFLLIVASIVTVTADDPPAQTVRIPRTPEGEIEVGDLIERLADAIGSTDVPRPEGSLHLPLDGVAGTFSRKLLGDALGPGVHFTVEANQVAIVVPLDRPNSRGKVELESRLRELTVKVRAAASRSQKYGLHARASYRPNDPTHPTVCLLHGLNSSSDSFRHLAPALEEHGFGIVVYDYPFNRRLAENVATFEADWAAFRKEHAERQPWAILGHSMGCLIARAYVEGDTFHDDVSSLILIAPPNRGAALARNQTVAQLVQAMRDTPSRALADLSDGVAASAEDLAPGSAFLKSLAARPRRAGVAYHIVAGNVGFLSREARGRIDSQLGLVATNSTFLGGLARLAESQLKAQLDEITNGTGDGCVSLASTELDGVTDRVVIPANHVELVRGPLLFPDSGPIVSLPYILKWLGEKEPE